MLVILAPVVSDTAVGGTKCSTDIEKEKILGHGVRMDGDISPPQHADYFDSVTAWNIIDIMEDGRSLFYLYNWKYRGKIKALDYKLE
jgi:hypothetical protein